MAIRAISIGLYLPAYIIGLLVIGRKFWRASIFTKERRPFNFYFSELILGALCMTPSSMLAAHAWHEFDFTEPNSWYWAVAAFALASGTITGLFIGKVNNEHARSVAANAWKSVETVVCGFLVGVALAVGLSLVLVMIGVAFFLAGVYCEVFIDVLIQIIFGVGRWTIWPEPRQKDKKERG